MFENLFSTLCVALVGNNGRALSGKALETAEAAMAEAQCTGNKIWSDRNGFVFTRKRALFASAVQLVDANGVPVRICGHRVSNKAKFCSKCGASAPGSWWRCGGCGQKISSESRTCPHCGREQNTERRGNLANGIWKKAEDVFAERFEFPEVESLIGDGLNIQEGQCAVLLQGGVVIGTLSPGFRTNLAKPDSDELDGPFSSGFLNAPAAVNNSIRFVRSKPQNRNKNFHQHLPTYPIPTDRRQLSINTKNIESTFNESTNCQQKPRKSEISPLTFS